jgi:hypothetical protein
MTKDKKQNLDSVNTKKEYFYNTAGLREREGHIPIGLIWLGVGLLIWAVYYLVKFWSLA